MRPLPRKPSFSKTKGKNVAINIGILDLFLNNLKIIFSKKIPFSAEFLQMLNYVPSVKRAKKILGSPFLFNFGPGREHRLKSLQV